jgi:hypothetical protein
MNSGPSSCLIVSDTIDHDLAIGTLLPRAACPLVVLRRPLHRPKTPSVLPVTTGGINKGAVFPRTLPPRTAPLPSVPSIGTGGQHCVNARIHPRPLLLPHLFPLDTTGISIIIITRDLPIAMFLSPIFAPLVLTPAQLQVRRTAIMNA